MKSLAKINSTAASTATKQKATIQPKLKVSSPGDQYEQEADAMAERVMHFSGESTTEHIPTTGMIARSVQRNTEMDAGNTTILSGSGAGFMAPMGLVSQLGNTGNGGATLPVDTRGFMEDAFSTGFAGVRIHTDSDASAMAESIQAKAFTYGEDIYFNAGEFNPQTDEGKELLAHELTHVIQQRKGAGGGMIQRRANTRAAAATPTSSPLGIAQLLVDRLNRQSGAIRYQFADNSFIYTVINEAALSNFDWQMRALVDLGDAFLIKLADLLTMSGLPETARSGQPFTDLNGLLANDDATFQNLVVGFFGGAGAIPEVDETLSSASVDPGLAIATSDSTSSDIDAAATASLEPVATAADEVAGATALEALPISEALPPTEDAAAAQAPLSPDLLMPEAPSTLSAPAQERLSQAQSAASSNASRSGSLPSDSEITAEAQGGVSEPEEETQARASGSLTEALTQRAEPSPEIEELCANIQRAIRERRPPDEDSLLSADPEAAANEVGDQLNTSISDDADRVGSSYDELDNPPAGSPEQVGETPDLPPAEFEASEINARQAVPDPIPAENVSLDNDVQSTQSSMDEAGMSSDAAAAITDPNNPVVMAREAQGELEETANEDPAQVLEAQNTAITDAQTHMEELQAQALQALVASRSGAVAGTGQQQTALIGTEEQKRAEVGRRAEAVFTAAQAGVDQLLQPLTQTAMDMWDTGKTRISTEFRQHLDRVQRWVDDRYSGAGGFVLEVVEDVIGMPDWVTEQYNDAEQTFSDDICAKIREISTHVSTVILACEEIINNADRDIARVFEDARGELGDWVDQQREGFATRIEGLRTQVHETRDNFNRDLATQAAETVQAVREEVHALRQAAGGLVGRIRDAITAFAEDPVRFIIDGLLSLVGIEPARFWALASRIGTVIDDLAADPMGFASHLLAAVGDGFGLFFDNFGTHLLDGLIGWLFSGLGAMGIQVPRELSLSSIVTFFLQVMGITWDRIRRLLAEQIGEENVELIEQAFEMVSNLIEMGPAGIFEMIKDMLNPQTILDSIIQMAIDFMVETIATQAATRFALLFVPGGAIAQAVEAIYKVLRWIFENAASIFTLVETVVNGIANIISGNTAAMSLAVEQALSRLMIPVIDFVAGFLNMGDLPQRVADAVEGMQEWMEGLLRRAIRWMADQARALMSALGFGEEEEGEEDNDLEDTEVGESMPFSVEGEMHRLWISTEGAGVEVMVSSIPTTVDHKLTEWEGRVNTLPEEVQSEARGLLSTARQQYQTTKQEGAEAEQEIDQARQNSESQEVDQAEQADQEVESAEQALKSTLMQLFEVFGAEGENEIIENFQMHGENHTLTINISDKEVSLGSAKGPIRPKLTAALEKLEEYQGAPEARNAQSQIQNMDSLLTQIFGALEQGTQVDRSQLRQFSRETKQALDLYGETFNVKDIVDGLPNFGPVKVAPHPVRPDENNPQPDGSVRESHHVPSKELAQALAREMRITAQVLLSKRTPVAKSVADVLEPKAASIIAKRDGDDLSAISLHRVTHQNSGGVAVHAAAMRAEIEAAIEQMDATNRTETIRIINTIAGDLAVNPSGKTLDEFIEEVRDRVVEEQLTEFEQEQADQVVATVIRTTHNAERAGVERGEELLKLISKRAFESSLTQGKAAVFSALQHSILDGPHSERMAKVNEIDGVAKETWKEQGLIED